MRITPQQRKAVNKKLGAISSTHHISVPITEIDQVLRDSEMKLIQEDGTDWSGFLCGRQGGCHIQVASMDGTPYPNLLCLQWYKDQSTTFEINCYLS